MTDMKAPGGWSSRHPLIVNAVIIMVVALAGIFIIYLSIAIFTKHGESDVVPGVENMTYTEAVNTLHKHGFKVDIRDSLYKDNVKPGMVIEQYPKANSVVKPGRKIFLYINAVHPKEVVIDDDNHPMIDALRGFSFRSGMARLEELGFKNIGVRRVLGESDCIIQLTANGQPVKKMQKVPVNARIVVKVSDGQLDMLRDSLQNAELLEYEEDYSNPGRTLEDQSNGVDDYPHSSSSSVPSKSGPSPIGEEEIEYF